MKWKNYIVLCIICLSFNACVKVDPGADLFETGDNSDTLFQALASKVWVAKEEAIDSNGNNTDETFEWKKIDDSVTYKYSLHNTRKGFCYQYRIGKDTSYDITWSVYYTGGLTIRDEKYPSEYKSYFVLSVSSKELLITNNNQYTSQIKNWIKFSKQ